MGLGYLVVTILLLYSDSYVTSAASNWTYWGKNGPAHWPGICNTGQRQSPINIITEDTIKADLGSLKFIRYDYAFNATITNTGHTVEIRFDGVPIQLEGADLGSTYIFEQMHFHWGAEHTVDGVRDALELHLVHYDTQYPNISIAAQFEHGIAVVATLFELSDQYNSALTPILMGTKAVSERVGETVPIGKSKIIPYLYLPKDHTTYYRYDGSLTTPGCQESVMWFVLTEKLPISQEQLNIFRKVRTYNDTLLFNYRPTQALGDRKVYHHLEGYSAATVSSPNAVYPLLSCLAVRMLNY